jgi:hypothetical protein
MSKKIKILFGFILYVVLVVLTMHFSKSFLFREIDLGLGLYVLILFALTLPILGGFKFYSDVWKLFVNPIEFHNEQSLNNVRQNISLLKSIIISVIIIFTAFDLVIKLSDVSFLFKDGFSFNAMLGNVISLFMPFIKLFFNSTIIFVVLEAINIRIELITYGNVN